jgi:hypothetical protein
VLRRRVETKTQTILDTTSDVSFFSPLLVLALFFTVL